MRIYTAPSEEAVHARDQLKDWVSEGFLSEAQYRLMEQDTACDLRQTNVFLRIVLCFFTLIIVGAGVGLFFVVSSPGTRPAGVFLLVFAALSYTAAEFAVSQARLYRYGIEEALCACSVGLLCAGLYATSSSPQNGGFLVPAMGALASLWIWTRFGLPYAVLATMLFVPWVAGTLTPIHAEQRIFAALIYAAGLAIVVVLRRPFRLTFLDTQYSIAEAVLWLGIYLTINVELVPRAAWEIRSADTTEFSRPLYWTTWVLIWCLPPVVLTRGLRRKDRLVIAVGAVTAILTLATSKSYLGWQRHTWDPMLLGALLTGIALYLRRWLAAGSGEVRRGFTAARLSGRDKTWLNVGTTAIAFTSPVTPNPQPSEPEVPFEGGKSGGGGASSDF